MSPSGAVTCELSEQPDVENDGCTITNSVACVDSAGYVTEAVGITTQQTQDGSLITGVMTITIRQQNSGRVECTSTYDVMYERE